MSWADARLDEIAEVTLGQSPPGSSYNALGDGMPFFQGKAEFGELRPAVRKWTTAGSKFAQTDDILLSVRAPVGPTNLAPVDCVIGRGLAAIRPRDGVNPRYVLWALRATARDLASRATGSTFDAVTGKQVKAHRVPVAPLNEQRRIVAAIEEHLSRLDAADGFLAAALRRLDGLRRSALIAVFPGDAPTAALGDLATVIRGVTYKKEQARSEAGEGFVPILRATNIGDRLDFEGLVYVPDEVVRAEQRVRVGDVVLAASSGSAAVVGKSAMVTQPWHGSFGAFCTVVRARNTVDPSYVAAYLSSPVVRRRWSELAAGTNINNLKREHISGTPVPVPPLSEQQRIVAEVEERLSRIDAMRASIERAQRRSQALRAAILERAFRGELVPQDPSDEPAEALLARIRAERDVSIKATGRRRKTVRP